MSLQINYMIALLLGIIVLIAVVIFLLTGRAIGEEIELENQLRICCDKFIANGCEWTSGQLIICSEENFITLGELANKLNMNENQVKTFCRC